MKSKIETMSWEGIMREAEKSGFILQCYGGVAILASHEVQKKEGIFEKTQYENDTIKNKKTR